MSPEPGLVGQDYVALGTGGPGTEGATDAGSEDWEDDEEEEEGGGPPARCLLCAWPPRLDLPSEARGRVLVRWLVGGLLACMAAHTTALALLLTNAVHDAALWGPVLFGDGTTPVTGPQNGNAYVHGVGVGGGCTWRW